MRFSHLLIVGAATAALGAALPKPAAAACESAADFLTKSVAAGDFIAELSTAEVMAMQHGENTVHLRKGEAPVKLSDAYLLWNGHAFALMSMDEKGCFAGIGIVSLKVLSALGTLAIPSAGAR